MRAFTISSKGKTLMSVFTYNRRNCVLCIKTLIQVFPLELIVKARMFGHAILGRFRDERSTRTMTPSTHTTLSPPFTNNSII